MLWLVCCGVYCGSVFDVSIVLFFPKMFCFLNTSSSSPIQTKILDLPAESGSLCFYQPFRISSGGTETPAEERHRDGDTEIARLGSEVGVDHEGEPGFVRGVVNVSVRLR